MNEPDPPFEWLRDFKPGFDSLSKDQDRIMDLLVTADDAGKVDRSDGRPLLPHYLDASDGLQEVCFSRACQG